MLEVRSTSRRIWRGAAVLTVAAVMVKIMSVVYRLLYQNFAGDVGFYVYQQIYPLYALAVTLGGTGFPVVISQYMAEADGGRRDRKILQWHALLALLILCGMFFCFLFLLSAPLTEMMGDRRLAPMVRIAAAIYLYVPLIAVLRGGFQGQNENMLPTAVSQIGEQLTRVTVIIGLSWYLFLHHGNPYQFGRAAILGSAIAPATALIILALFATRRKFSTLMPFRGVFRRINWHLVKDFLIRGSLFSILAVPLFPFQLVDSLTVIPLLSGAHVTDPRIQKGIYDRAYLLTQFGMVAAASLTASIIPGLARFAALRQRNEMQNQAGLVLRMSLAFGLAAASGLAVLSGEINTMLFRNSDGTPTFAIIAFTLLTLPLILTSSGVLEAAGRPWLPILYLAVGACAKWAGNCLLIPLFSISGAAAATGLGTLLTAWLNIHALRRLALMTPLQPERVVRLVCAVAGMAAAVFLWAQGLSRWLPDSRGAAVAVALPGVVLGGCVFVLLLMVVRYFSPADLYRLPAVGNYLRRRQHRKRKK